MLNNKELDNAMNKIGYAMDDIPEEYTKENPEEEIHYILKDGELYEE